MFAALSIVLAPQLPIQPTAFALVGMTALFSGASRAPLTGIILVTEMTENTSLLLPMLCACFTAMLTPTILGNPSIYESLRNLVLMRAKKS
jgi:CIC family chloride channel protein